MKSSKYKNKYNVYDINKVERFFVDVRFRTFCKSNFILIGILILILFVVLTICLVFAGKSENFSTMAISILTSGLIYIGTSILTIMQFFQTWQTQQIDTSNKTILLNIQTLNIAEEKLLKNEDNDSTKIYAKTANTEDCQIGFHVEYYNKTNFKIIDFDTLYFISIKNKTCGLESLSLHSKESSTDLDNEYKNFSSTYYIPKKKMMQFIKNDYKNFFIVSVFTDEFFEDYFVLHCFILTEENDFISSTQILKEGNFYKKYGAKFNKRFVKNIYTSFSLED